MHPVSRRAAIKLNELVFRTRSTPVAIGIRTLFPMRRTAVRSKHGAFLIDPLSHFGYFILRDGEYEPRLSRLLERNVRPGDIVMDCGAHEGYFSMLASHAVGRSGRVIACEPQSRAREILVRNLELNRARNVTVLPVAVSDRAGSATLHLTTGHNTGASGLAEGTSRLPERTESVRTQTLSTLAEQCGLSRIDLIKMDIEGHEYEAIFGSEALFRDRVVRAIALEFHGGHMMRRGLSPTDIWSFLEACGYALDRSQSEDLAALDGTMLFIAPE